jgi:predicted nuclease of predicted toxin-antitoxin system
MIRFYFDENIHGAITRGLRQRGVDVLTVVEDNREGLPDPEVLDRAGELGRVLFSHDTDMLAEAARRQREGISFGGILYARQLPSEIGTYVNDLELIAVLEELEEYQNRVRYLPI